MVNVARALLLFLVVAPGPAPPEDPALVRARRLLAAHPVFDGHNDLPYAIREDANAAGAVERYDLRSRTPGHTDLARIKEGGLGAQFWSVYVPGDSKGGFARSQLERSTSPAAWSRGTPTRSRGPSPRTRWSGR